MHICAHICIYAQIYVYMFAAADKAYGLCQLHGVQRPLAKLRISKAFGVRCRGDAWCQDDATDADAKFVLPLDMHLSSDDDD